MTILLVRHAHAGERGLWSDDDRARPLSEHGVAQAQALVDLLADFPVDRVLSSPFARCVQSVQPLAETRGLKVEPTDVLAEGIAKDAVAVLLSGLAGQDVVLCSHGDVIPQALRWLGEHGVDLGDDLRHQKASTWVVEAADGTLTRARYLPPPKV